MTLGEFRKLTEGMQDDAPLLTWMRETIPGLRPMLAERRMVSHEPGGSLADWWGGGLTENMVEAVVLL
jgi:hypothetical protein